MHLYQEGWFAGQRQDPLLDHGALDVVVLNDDVLLQDLDCIELIRSLPLGKHHLYGKKDQHIVKLLLHKEAEKVYKTYNNTFH